MKEEYIKLSYFFKVLADSTRVEIISVLLSGEKSVGQIVEITGHSQSAISHQLRILRNGRIVKSRKDGHHVYYSIDDMHVEKLFKLGIEHVSHD